MKYYIQKEAPRNFRFVSKYKGGVPKNVTPRYYTIEKNGEELYLICDWHSIVVSINEFKRCYELAEEQL